jgi:hypothetical protein
VICEIWEARRLAKDEKMGIILTVVYIVFCCFSLGCSDKESNNGNNKLRRAESNGHSGKQNEVDGSIHPDMPDATIDVDWHIGPFAGLFLGMSFNEVPDKLEAAEAIDRDFVDSNLMPDEKSRLSFLQHCLDRKHLYLTFPLKYSFSLFNLRSDRQELLFVGDFDWNLLYSEVAEQMGKNSFESVPALPAVDQRLQSALSDSKLMYITVFPTKEKIEEAASILTQYFASDPKTVNTPKVEFYFIKPRGGVDRLTFWYVMYTWLMGSMIVECHEIHENDRTTASYVVMRSLDSVAPNQLPKGFADSQGVLSPETVSSFMKSLKNRSWRVGYGWVRETLGPPLKGFNPWGLPNWPSLWESNKNNLLYIVDFGRVFRYMSLQFDEQGLLFYTSLVPEMEGDASSYAPQSSDMSASGRDNTPEAIPERGKSTNTKTSDRTSLYPNTESKVPVDAVEWVMTVSAEANSIIQTTDGGYGVCGRTDSKGMGHSDFWILKLDGRGREMWDMTYGGADYDAANSIIQTSDGGYAVIGHKELQQILLKLDGRGKMMWDRVYSSTVDKANSFIQTSDGNYAICGIIRPNGTPWSDVSILKSDCNGRLIWEKTYGSKDTQDEAQSIIQTSDGGYAVCGSTTSKHTESGGGLDFIARILKLDSSGEIVWDRTYEDHGLCGAYSIVQTSDGGYVVCGVNSKLEIWIFMLDDSGQMKWQRTYGGTARSIIKTSDGGYAVCGYTRPKGREKEDFLILKLDSNGRLIWEETYGSKDAHDQAQSIIQTSDGGFAVCGGSIILKLKGTRELK